MRHHARWLRVLASRCPALHFVAQAGCGAHLHFESEIRRRIVKASK